MIRRPELRARLDIVVRRPRRDVPPVRFTRDPGHERALRAANGADLHAEAATSIVIVAALVVMLFVVVGLIVSA